MFGFEFANSEFMAGVLFDLVSKKMELIPIGLGYLMDRDFKHIIVIDRLDDPFNEGRRGGIIGAVDDRIWRSDVTSHKHVVGSRTKVIG